MFFHMVSSGVTGTGFHVSPSEWLDFIVFEIWGGKSSVVEIFELCIMNFHIFVLFFHKTTKITINDILREPEQWQQPLLKKSVI